jgi:perosamine synthetase|tara:strand:+ start:352 stop:1446 length:1095 start_codon:yes stop_codon:yes gene_type:complete
MIPWARPNYHGYEKKYVNQVLKSTWLGDGIFIKNFEKIFSKYINSKSAISVSNGTIAIHLVYLAMGLKKGDEVIVPGFGYLAAANVALQMGIKPVFADVDLETFCVTAKNIEKKITNKTKLIVVIHTYGNVCELDPIIKIAKSKKITVLEDSAESLGSKYKGKQSGGVADIGTYSFHATKTITTGEGGMIVTNKNKEFTERLRAFRDHGVKVTRYFHHLPGHNFRLTNIQAAIGYAQMENFSKIDTERRRVYRYYIKLFKNIDGIRPQIFSSQIDPVVWTFAIVLDPEVFIHRDKIIKKMKDQGVETRNGFYSPCRLPLYKKYKTSHLKNSNKLSKNIICLPFFTSLKEKEIDYIAKTLLRFKR